MPNIESSAEALSTPRLQKTKAFFEALEGGSSEPATPPVREGLPPGYRMRADPHYVDLLASRTTVGRERTLAVHAIDSPILTDAATIEPLVESIKRHGVLQPLLIQETNGTHRLIAGQKRLSAAIAAGLREVPCVLYDVDDAEAATLAEASNLTAVPAPKPPVSDPTLHAGTELAQALATLGACTDLLSGPQSDLSRAVVGNLIRAEVWRASCLLNATRVVRQELPVARAAMDVAGMLCRLESGFQAERHVRAVALESKSDLPHGSFMAADEKMVAAALAGMVLSTFALFTSVQGRVVIGAARTGGDAIAFSVAQDIVVAPEIWSARAFDAEWTERPGGVSATVMLAAAARTADAHDGTVAAEITRRGTRLTLTLPSGL